MQVVLHTSIVVKLAKFESWSTWETSWNQICFIPGLPSACLLFLSFKAIGKVWLGEVNLFFCPHHPPLFYPNKIMYELSFHHWLSYVIDFSNLWAPRQIWTLLYAPMGDLLRFSKPTFDQIRMESQCIQIYHVIIYCGSLWLHRVGYCTLIQYKLVFCSIFSLLCV